MNNAPKSVHRRPYHWVLQVLCLIASITLMGCAKPSPSDTAGAVAGEPSSELAAVGSSPESTAASRAPDEPKAADPIAVAAVGTLASEAQVMLWHPYQGDERVGLEQALAAYNKTATVPVVSQAVPAALMGAKLGMIVPKGQGPDLVVTSHVAVQSWRAADLLAPVSPTPFTESRDVYVPGASKAFAAAGRQFGIPLTAKPVLMFCNTTLVPEFPTAIETLLARKDLGKATPLLYPLADPYFHATWVHRFGGALTTDGLPNVLGAGHTEALAFLRKHFMGRDSPSASVVTKAFNQGKAACVLAGSWFGPEVASNIKVSVGPVPSLNGGVAKPLVQFEGVVLTRSSKQRSAALAAARFLAGPGGASKRRDLGKQPVAHRATAEADPALVSKAALAQLSQAVPLPAIGGGAGSHPFWRRMGEVLASAISTGGAFVPKTALRDLQRRIDGAKPKEKP